MTTSHPGFMLNGPGALIAAVPAILGFVPEKSLVLVNIENGALGAVIRADLSERLIDDLRQMAEVAAVAKPDAAIVVIVDADGARCPVCRDEHRQLADAMAKTLATQGVPLRAAHIVDKVEPGGRWYCADGCGAWGDVDDPFSSPLAVAAVLEGRRLYRRRGDLEEVVAVVDVSRQKTLADLIGRQLDSCDAARGDDPESRTRRDTEYAIAMAAETAGGRAPSDEELVRLASAVTDIRTRDVLFALAVGDRAAEAESLWATLSRTLPDPWRVEALTLLAFSAYVRGAGTLARIALEAALRSDPTHRMAGMLDTALQSGMHPERISELAISSYQLADQLGVRLPPLRGWGRRAS
jgi:Domain of unknown function (DUF4192)